MKYKTYEVKKLTRLKNSGEVGIYIKIKIYSLWFTEGRGKWVTVNDRFGIIKA